MALEAQPLKLTPLLLMLAGTPCLAGDEQMPASPHQAEAIEDVERESAQRPRTEDRMPVTEHQDEAMRDHQAADLNKDGNVTEEEYAEYMEQRAAREYSRNLSEPERPGVDAQSPRNRAAAAGEKEPLPATDPTVADE